MKRILCLAVMALILAGAAVADSHEPKDEALTWISYSKNQPFKSQQLTAALKEQFGPVFDQMLGDGVALSWGIVSAITHDRGDDWTHAVWITTRNWAGMGTMEKAFGAAMMAMDPAALAEREKRYAAAVEPGTHYDEVVETRVRWTGGDTPPKFMRFGYYTALPGKGEDLIDLYKSFAVPIYKKLAADGVINGYGFYVANIHGDHGWTHTGWYAVDDLGRIDAVDAAFDAALAADPSVLQEIAGMSDMSAHSDRVVMVVHLGGTSGGEGGGMGKEEIGD